MQDREELKDWDKKFIHDSWMNLKDQLDEVMPLSKPGGNAVNKMLVVLLLISLLALSFISYLYFSRIPNVPFTKEIIKFEKIYVPVEVEAQQTHFTNKSLEPVSQNSIISHSDFEKFTSNRFDAFNLDQLKHDLSINSGSNIDQHLLDKNVEFLTPISNLDNHAIHSNQSSEVGQPENLASNGAISKHNRKFNFFFAATGFISNLDYSGHGVSLGLSLPIGQKLTFEGGVGLNYISKDYLILPFFSNPSYSDFKSNATADLNKANTFYEGLRGFKQVVLPFGINYHLNRKFSLNTGIKLRYTYSETIDRVLRTRAEQKLPGSETVANSFFNRSNLGISAGIDYQIGHSMSLRIDTEFGVNSLINNKNLTDPNYNKYDLNLINLSGYFKF